MRTVRLCCAVAAAMLAAAPLRAQTPSRPPLERYLMPKDAEVALARSAAPASISGRATIRILTASGFQTVAQGDNGFVCMVMRGWSAPTYTPAQFRNLVYDPDVRAPICFDPEAARTVMPYYELRTRLGMEGRTPDEIASALESAVVKGALPERARVSFGYMWSADQHLGPGIGHWHPHMMVFAPYYTNAMLGATDFGTPQPFVSDDGGTPFAVTVIPVDDRLAIRARPGSSTR
jgi:hypothetical protein